MKQNCNTIVEVKPSTPEDYPRADETSIEGRSRRHAAVHQYLSTSIETQPVEYSRPIFPCHVVSNDPANAELDRMEELNSYSSIPSMSHTFGPPQIQSSDQHQRSVDKSEVVQKTAQSATVVDGKTCFSNHSPTSETATSLKALPAALENRIADISSETFRSELQSQKDHSDVENPTACQTMTSNDEQCKHSNVQSENLIEEFENGSQQSDSGSLSPNVHCEGLPMSTRSLTDDVASPLNGSIAIENRCVGTLIESRSQSTENHSTKLEKSRILVVENYAQNTIPKEAYLVKAENHAAANTASCLDELEPDIMQRFCEASEEVKMWLQIGQTACDVVTDGGSDLTRDYHSKIQPVITKFLHDIKNISKSFERKANKVQVSQSNRNELDERPEATLGVEETSGAQLAKADDSPFEYGHYDGNTTDEYDVENIKIECMDDQQSYDEFEPLNCYQEARDEMDTQFENTANEQENSVGEILDGSADSERWKCKKCAKSFKTRKRLVQHRKTHKDELLHKRPMALFECQYCNKKFSSSQLLKAHARMHSSSLKCMLCKKTFPNKYKLKIHKTKAHPVHKMRQEENANDNSASGTVHEAAAENTEKEQNVDTPVSATGKVIQCGICAKTCISKASLYKHIKRLHDRPFKCAFCKKTFGFATELDAHVRIHTGEKPYKCDKCERTFYYRQALNQHKKMHANARPFKCTQCDAKFNYKKSLEMHTQRRHTDIKSFQCKHCDKAFVLQRELKWHEFIHTGVSDHKCGICDKYFSARGVLRKHIKDVHHIDLSSINFKTDKPNMPSLGGSDGDEDGFDSLECIDCGQAFDSAEVLESHYRSMHTDNPKNACHTCEKTFSNKRSLQKHIKGVHEKNLECDLCHRTFGFSHQLEAHKQNHLSARLFSCTTCDKKFKTKVTLEQHQKVHLELKPFVCTVCDKRCSTKAGLDQHVTRKHSTFRPLKCDVCSKGFVEEKELKWHMFSHTGKSDFQCHKCGRYFCAPHSLTKHMKAMHKEPPDPDLAEFRCNMCQEPLQNLDAVLAHEEMHTNEVLPSPDFTPKAWIDCIKCTQSFSTSPELQTHINEKHLAAEGHQCDSCGKLCPSKKSLYSHVRRVHEKSFKCDQCNKAFGFLPELETHKRTHSGEKPYECDFCSKTFHTPQILRQHKKVHVADTYECSQCGQKCSSKSHLQKHILRKHSNVKPFACEYCSKGFVTEQELNWHIFSHTGKSNYFCTICQKYFSAQNVLDKHIKTIHHGEKQLCPVCGKHVSGSLNIHVKAHTEKQFKCTLCEKSYAWGHLLKEHERTHTGEMPYSCEVCFRQFLGSANFAKHKKSHQNAVLR